MLIFETDPGTLKGDYVELGILMGSTGEHVHVEVIGKKVLRTPVGDAIEQLPNADTALLLICRGVAMLNGASGNPLAATIASALEMHHHALAQTAPPASGLVSASGMQLPMPGVGRG